LSIRLAQGLVRDFRGVSLVALMALTACTTDPQVDPGTTTRPGDPNPDGKPSGDVCTDGSQCKSGVCKDGSCKDASSTDGVRNGDESDVDCGGASAPKCDNDKACFAADDCKTKNCEANKCAPAVTPGNDKDGIQNNDETDIDCGGAKAPKCANGKKCKIAGDCVSATCGKGGVCVEPSHTDGVKNLGETDIDCGGPDAAAPRCAPGKACGDAGDCADKVCQGNVCKAPSFTDGIKNGNETDVDCGGPDPGPRCAADKACNANSDCSSDGCNYEKKCAISASCTTHMGGDTCGPNDVSGMKQESCCTKVDAGPYKLDKYQITAGRMRAMVERLGGNLKGYAMGLPAGKWNQADTDELPASTAEVNDALGSFGMAGKPKRSCDRTGAGGVGFGFGGHTYWTPPNGSDKSDFSKDTLDQKTLNCVSWPMIKLLCVFDGGHMITKAEMDYAFTNGGTSQYPWGNAPAYNAAVQDDRVVHQFSYATPDVPFGNLSKNASGDPAEIAYYVAPPGRRPMGNNSYGMADVGGNMLMFVDDGRRTANPPRSPFVWSISWERHGQEAAGINGNGYAYYNTQNNITLWGSSSVGPEAPYGYYGLGGRCGY
jgi:formylglycine-generating enzyme required for sulfatase activity